MFSEPGQQQPEEDHDLYQAQKSTSCVRDPVDTRLVKGIPRRILDDRNPIVPIIRPRVLDSAVTVSIDTP